MKDKRNKWKGRDKPELKHLLQLQSEEQLTAFVFGHLILESLLVQLIDTELKNSKEFDAFKIPFHAKVDLCLALGIIDKPVVGLLKQINNIRNKFAHHLGHKINFDDLFCLANTAADAGVDFSDETIFRNKKQSQEYYGEEGVIQETLSNTAMYLIFLLEDRGIHFVW